MDAIGYYICTLHSMLGHDKAAYVLGQPPGDKTACLICTYEQEPTEQNRQAVITALARAGQGE